MSIKDLADFTTISKYSHQIEALGRKETWNESINRVKEMHIEKLGPKYDLIRDDFEWAFSKVKEKKVLGSQRALQFGGPAILKKEARMYNCLAGYCDRPKFFSEYFWLLLCGCGVGFSVQKHHVAKLPSIRGRNKNAPIRFHVIEDSIEGWADAAQALLDSYFVFDTDIQTDKPRIIFDYSLIRPEGSPLSWGGKAPGPKGLQTALETVDRLLRTLTDSGASRLRPIDCYDICMHLSDAVLSGGIRRSATICLFSYDDGEMLTAKTGNWMKENPQRARSNNSAVIIRKLITRKEFRDFIAYIRQYGEPGVILTDDPDSLFNPCAEVGMFGYVNIEARTGSGFQACNLCEINGGAIESEEDFLECCEAAAILGTVQATYTNFGYLGEESKIIIEREALLGVSMTGIMENPDICLNPSLQQKGAKLILKTNKRIAKLLGINPCARATCIKPSGTAACMLGTCSGIHPHHARRYIRRVQVNKNESPLKFYELHNPLAVEESVWSKNKTDKVIAFTCEVPKGAITKNQMKALDLLKCVLTTQRNWVEAGTDLSLCVQPWLRHNVSNTVTVENDEWEEVTDFIYENRDSFACVSLLPVTGDRDYPQAPFTRIYTPEEIVKEYGDASVFVSGIIENALLAFNNDLWKACDFLQYPDRFAQLDQPIDECIREDFRQRAVRFANRYFNGDMNRVVYLMKDVSNWKYWVDLKNAHKTPDWNLYNEKVFSEDNTFNVNTLAGEACSGGACEIGELGLAIKDASNSKKFHATVAA